MTRYCTVAQAKLELESQSTQASLTSLLFSYAGVVSARIDNIMNTPRKRPYFAPYVEQRAYVISANRINSRNNTFLIDDNLLVINALSIDGTVFTSSVSQFPPVTDAK